MRVRHSLTMSRRRHRPRPRYFLTVQAAQATEDASGPHGTLGTPGWGVGDVAFEFTLEGVDLLDTVGTLRLAVEDKFFIPRTHQLLCGPLPSPQPLADDDATLLSLGIVPGRARARPPVGHRASIVPAVRERAQLSIRPSDLHASTPPRATRRYDASRSEQLLRGVACVVSWISPRASQRVVVVRPSHAAACMTRARSSIRRGDLPVGRPLVAQR